MKRPESMLQVSVIAYLRTVLPKTVRAYSSQSGMVTSKASAGRAKAEGMTAGVPDITFVRQGGHIAYIELKADKGRLSPAQVEWLDWCAEMQIPAAICRSLDDVKAMLFAWGIPTRESGQERIAA